MEKRKTRMGRGWKKEKRKRNKRKPRKGKDIPPSTLIG